VSASPTPPKSLESLRQAALGVVVTTWLISGFWKVVEFDQFAWIVDRHGILSPMLATQLWIVPTFELAVAIGVAVTVGLPQCPRAAMTALGASAIGVAALTAYIISLDGDVIRRVGCGCHGSSTTALMPSTKSAVIFVNTSLLVLHAVVALGRHRAVQTDGVSAPSTTSTG
jgi:uncharacterized membrane protein